MSNAKKDYRVWLDPKIYSALLCIAKEHFPNKKKPLAAFLESIAVKNIIYVEDSFQETINALSEAMKKEEKNDGRR